MRAIHSYSSVPRSPAVTPDGSGSAIMRAYQVLLLILSSQQWRRLHGPVVLYADPPTLDLFGRLRILGLWDEVNDAVLVPAAFERIDVQVFWTASRLLALQNETAPCVSLDTDFVLWKPIDRQLDANAAIAHWEDTADTRWYGSLDTLTAPPRYRFPQRWQTRRLRAANNSFMYFGSEPLRADYVRNSLDYIRDNPVKSGPDRFPKREVLFSDQLLLSHCLADHGIDPATLTELVWHPTPGEWRSDGASVYWSFADIVNSRSFTHTWLYKNRLDAEPRERQLYCRDLITSIGENCPSWRATAIDVAQTLA